MYNQILGTEEGLNATEQSEVETFRLSPQQRRIWQFQEHRGKKAFCAQCVLKIEGELNSELLRLALNEVIAEHEILRTRFQLSSVDHIPYQIISSREIAALPCHDLSLSDSLHDEIRTIVETERNRDFDYALGDLLHPRLIRLGDENHLLILTLSALCADSPSLTILSTSLGRAYKSRLDCWPLSEGSIQYTELSELFNQLLEAEDTTIGRQYWIEHIDVDSLGISLPFEKRLPPHYLFETERLLTTLNAETCGRIEKLTGQLGVDFGSFLLTCWGIILSRLADRSEITIGTAIDGRTYQDTELALGSIVRYIPLKLNNTIGMRFHECLEKISQAMKTAVAWHDYFDWSLIKTIPDSSSPVFLPFAFDYQETTAEGSYDKIKLSLADRYVCTEEFRIRLSCLLKKDHLLINFDYNPLSIERGDIVSLIEQWNTLLNNALSHPDSLIKELDTVNSESRHQILFGFNQTKVDYGKSKLLHELIEKQAHDTPDNTAVSFRDRTVSYRELNERGNQLAHYLRGRGIGVESRVGVCLERSIELVVALLGALKAGAAYVPLDHTHPSQRLQWMIGNAALQVAITKRDLQPLMADHLPTVCIDREWEVISCFDKQAPQVQLSPENLAYVIYTSGSTGWPKGAMNTHGGISNRLLWMQEVYALTAEDRVIQKTPFTFDVSVWEFFWPLMTGATLVMAEPDGHRDSRYLLKEIARTGVTTLHFVPSMMRVFLEEESLEECESLRRVMSSGEELSGQLEKRFHERMKCDLFNLYGPTEAAVDVTWWKCERGESAERVPIGKPIANTQLYILDEEQAVVAVGRPGELYIAGVGLARGYINQGEQTAEKFIPDPYSGESGARMYRTGDLARYRRDGAIEYLGRKDNQIKVRGFRVELGEIEIGVRQEGNVRECAVMAQEGAGGQVQLVCYVEAEANDWSAEVVRERLRERLPEYMVPQVYVRLERLPLTANGKIDRRALPELGSFDREENKGYVAPRTPIEEALAQIWSDVLGVHCIGVHDSFFDIGGHSLSAMQVVSRLNQVFRVDLLMSEFFIAPTIADLEKKLLPALGQSRGRQAPPIGERTRNDKIPLSYSQQRIWFLEQLNPGTSAFNIPFTIPIDSEFDYPALHRSFNKVIERHEALRTRLLTIDGQPVQVIDEPWNIVIPVIDLSQVDGASRENEISRHIEESERRPFNLISDHLLRVKILRLDDDSHLLLICLHHIIADDWSIQLLSKEVTQLYESYSRGESVELEPQTLQYADYALWQRESVGEQILEQETGYWRKQLAGMPAALELPIDKPRPAVMSTRGGVETMVLDEELSRALLDLSRNNGATLFMTMLAGWATLLSLYSGQEEIVVGTPVSCRNKVELENVVGLFLNTLVLRVPVKRDADLCELLGTVRDVCLQAYTHQDMPFEKLVEALQPDRDLSRSPLFQAWINLLNRSERLNRGSDDADNLSNGEVEARYDLSLYVHQYSNIIGLELIYNRDVFEPVSIKGMANHLESILRVMADNIEGRWIDFFLRHKNERAVAQASLIRPHQVFTEFSKADVSLSIPARFEKQVEKYPHRVAINVVDRSVSYRELKQQADKIAMIILGLVGPGEDRIALLFDHGIEMIAGMLAVLKAGKVYVPLDPAHPTTRIDYILKDAQARIILTDQANIAMAEKLADESVKILNLDDPALTNTCDKDNGKLPQVSPDALAYILYTSGSTGQPKGVIQNHRNVLHFIRAYTDNLHIRAEDSLSLLSSYSFDAAIMDIYGALLNGAMLCPINIEQGISKVVEQLTAARITIYHSTPTIFRCVFGGLSDDRILDDLRLVVLGGEEVLVTDVDLYRKHCLTDCLMVNGLGPTESTVTLQYFIDRKSSFTGYTVPVGYPVEETEITLLDKNGRETLIFGEIAIRSPYIALGYWRKPETTGGVFLPDPDGGNRRIYCTGDLARRLPDNGLAFMGRKDAQIKIHGIRIEPGEIESVLMEQPAIRESAVIAKKGQQQEEYLVAFVVLNESLSSDQLRAYLRERLPMYMVPAAIIDISSLPLTPTGKIDRRALQISDQAQIVRPDDFVPPRDAIELQLANIWRDLLNQEIIGVTQSFFEIGGTSLIALIMIDRIERQFGVRLSLSTFLSESTIERIAAALRRKSANARFSSLVPINSRGSKSPFFCVHPVSGHITCYLDLARHLDPDRPFYGLQSRGLDIEYLPHSSIEEMAAHYVQMIRRVQLNGPYHIGGWSMGGVVAFEIARQLCGEGERVGMLALFDTEPPSRTPREDDRDLTSDAELVIRAIGQDLQISTEQLKGLSPEEQDAYVIDAARKANIIVPDLDHPRARRLFDVYRSNRRALLNYGAQTHRGRVILFSCANGATEEIADPTFGWSELVAGEVEVVPVPGEHKTMVYPPYVETLASRINEYFARAESEVEPAMAVE
jgi:amino acid adenylation domain-containing protein